MNNRNKSAPNYFNNLAIPFAKSNGINLYGKAAKDIFSGWSLYEITDFNRTTYVTCLGDIGQMTLINGGYTFSNKSAGVALSEPNIIAAGQGGKFYEADVRYISEGFNSSSYFAGAINTKKSTYEAYQRWGLNSLTGKHLMHEFGHFLQNKYGGNLWYNLIVVPTSAINFNMEINKSNSYFLYNRTWTEVQANTMSYYYFNYPSFWDFNNYPVNFNYIGDELKRKLYYH
jgi:hypothetical protein